MIDLPALNHVMVDTDLKTGSTQVYVHGLRLALAAQGKLTLVHVKPPGSKQDWHELPTVRDELTQWGVLSADHAEAEYAALGLTVHPIMREAVDPLPVLVKEAVERKPDLIVFGTENRKGLENLARYSVSEHVARASGIPALFIARGHRGFVDPVTGTPRLNRVLVPVGGDMPLQEAVGWTSQLLELLDVDRAEVTLLHVGPEWDWSLELPARKGWTWKPVAKPGLVVPVVVQLAEALTPDLIVMVTQGGKGALRGLLGSNTERVLHQVSCPVLAIPV